MENASSRRLLLNVSPGGSRWFDGANESVDDPTYSIRVGHLAGVDTIFAPISHTDLDPLTPGAQQAATSTHMQCSPYVTAALGVQGDIELTWGPGGTVASVHDVTNNADVAFHAVPQAGYGFIPDGNGNGVIDWVDFEYTEGIAQAVDQLGFCGTAVGFPPEFTDPGPGARTLLTQQPAIGPVSAIADPANGTDADFTTTGSGFGLLHQRTAVHLPVDGRAAAGRRDQVDAAGLLRRRSRLEGCGVGRSGRLHLHPGRRDAVDPRAPGPVRRGQSDHDRSRGDE